LIFLYPRKIVFFNDVKFKILFFTLLIENKISTFIFFNYVSLSPSSGSEQWWLIYLPVTYKGEKKCLQSIEEAMSDKPWKQHFGKIVLIGRLQWGWGVLWYIYKGDKKGWTSSNNKQTEEPSRK